MRDMLRTGQILDQLLVENGFGDHDGQVFGLAEEAGEFVGAYRRYTNRARRSDTFEHVSEELADVIITAYVTASRLGIAIDLEIDKKLSTILTRGWREELV